MHDSTTHGIANKGFSGIRGNVSRFNFGNGGYERSPQSLTGHTVNVKQTQHELIKKELKEF